MKLLQFSAGSSNSGKTVTSMIVARGLKNKGYEVQGFKCGPDFIDTKLLALASGREPANLDLFLMGESGLWDSINLSNSELGILEGAMGYFDGIGNTMEASAYKIAEAIGINTVLIYHPSGEMHTIIPKLKGMVDYSKGRIKGVIFSNTTEKMYEMLKDMFEENPVTEVLGYTKKEERLNLKSRSLGLMLPEELSELDKPLDDAATISYETLDYDKILELMVEVEVKNSEELIDFKPKMAIAEDETFSFIYGENRKLFNKYFQVEYFSPLSHTKLPKADFVFLPGGYPEDYLEQLSGNTSMINSIRNYVNNGGLLYAEGGGLMYLVDSIEGVPMCGVLNGEVSMRDRLQNFGYMKVETVEDSLLGPKGTKFHAHEFHYSHLETEEKGIFHVEKARGSGTIYSGYRINNAILSYQHINFCGNENILKHIVRMVGGNNVYK